MHVRGLRRNSGYDARSLASPWPLRLDPVKMHSLDMHSLDMHSPDMHSPDMPVLYMLVVDKAWAKLYRTAQVTRPLSLVYHQALFGSASADAATADEELARSLCRLLRADRLTGKYGRIVMLASPRMLMALQRQYDGEWKHVVTGNIGDLPARYTDDDLGAWLQQLDAQPKRRRKHKEMATAGVPQR